MSGGVNIESMKADTQFRSWISVYLPTWEKEKESFLLGLYEAWSAVKDHPNYKLVPSIYARIGDESFEPDLLRWVKIELQTKLIDIRARDLLVRRRKDI